MPTNAAATGDDGSTLNVNDPAYLPSYAEVCRTRSDSSLTSVTTIEDDSSGISFIPDPVARKTFCSKKRFFSSLMVASAMVLITGVVLAIMSINNYDYRVSGLAMILIGVFGTVCSAPCCFYMIMNVEFHRTVRRRRSSGESSDSHSPLPATVESIFPSMARGTRHDVVDGIRPPGPINLRRDTRSMPLSRHLISYPSYEPPPPYSPPQTEA